MGVMNPYLIDGVVISFGILKRTPMGVMNSKISSNRKLSNGILKRTPMGVMNVNNVVSHNITSNIEENSNGSNELIIHSLIRA